jgi:hypothetical protein
VEAPQFARQTAELSSLEENAASRYGVKLWAILFCQRHSFCRAGAEDQRSGRERDRGRRRCPEREVLHDVRSDPVDAGEHDRERG